jgi:hypothetical protein
MVWGMTRQDTTTPTNERLRRLLAEAEAAGQLRETGTDALLTTYASLTHRIHGARPTLAAADLLAQRDLIRAEILRRTGDL